MDDPPESKSSFDDLLTIKPARQDFLYLALGGNLGNPVQTFERALDLIDREIGRVQAVSEYYITAPLNPPELKETSQPNFLNIAVRCRTENDPTQILSAILDIEKQLGRDRSKELRWGPRLIDIDLIAFGSKIVALPNLTVPHPELPNRDFVLYPLRDVAIDFYHPELQLSIDELIYNFHAMGLPQFILDTLQQKKSASAL